MNALGVLLAMAMPFVALAILTGWAVPLIMGIARRRRDGSGRGLIVFGSVWGACALGLVIYVVSAVIGHSRRYQPMTFDADRAQGETGQIIIPWDGPCKLSVWPDGEHQLLVLRSDSGVLTAPAGRLQVLSWELTATDERGRKWSATGRPARGASADTFRLNVSPDQPVRLYVGPPLVARVVLRRGGSPELAIMDFQLTDRAGAQYTISGGANRPPGFEVVNAAGQVVWSGDFEYG